MQTSPIDTDQLRHLAARFPGLSASDPATLYHRCISMMHELCAAVREAELAGLSREEILAAVTPARVAHAESPFVRRLQHWPRGYPGDYETIEYLWANLNGAPPRTLAWAIEEYALRCGMAQQHRNKIAWQAHQIVRAAARANGWPARLLSVACGGSQDVGSVLDLLTDYPFELCLNDMDADALACSRDRLRALADRVSCVAGDVFRGSKVFAANGPFDLVIAGGLFDYLTDRQLGWLLPRLYDVLSPGGRLCFTNVAAQNPYRVWLEYLASWHITERSEAEIRAHLEALEPGGARGDGGGATVRVSRDSTGLTLLVEVQKPR